MALKNWFDNNDFQNRKVSATLTSSTQGNPFHTLPKEPPLVKVESSPSRTDPFRCPVPMASAVQQTFEDAVPPLLQPHVPRYSDTFS
ncbi:hypothetical protein GYMLUDRAFT_376679 [Collybiopsis luxurians FD-317 M1]|uniref:Uncharacterized protein n=1 Tax=Collybiopsis luxurians FD-317 M1 TaxID=944289 RepID=A0A0D0C221_9AGAR|nr:hypothetical protein GYMLUDRAFT_376679 [Collybiopsis luxurians FD-317 M1]